MKDKKASGIYEFGDEDRNKFKDIHLGAHKLLMDVNPLN